MWNMLHKEIQMDLQPGREDQMARMFLRYLEGALHEHAAAGDQDSLDQWGRVPGENSHFVFC